jgi:hypothetical protein
MSNLDPETIAVYIHSATKVFGYWAAELAERWEDDDLPQVKGIVDLILTRVSEFVGSPHVEVQERVSPCRSSASSAQHQRLSTGRKHPPAVHAHQR